MQTVRSRSLRAAALTTHYHGDHFGAMAELAGRIPIRDFIDHGPSVEKNQGTDALRGH